MANRFSPKRQAISDMMKAGLDVTLIKSESLIVSNEKLCVIKKGRIHEIG